MLVYIICLILIVIVIIETICLIKPVLYKDETKTKEAVSFVYNTMKAPKQMKTYLVDNGVYALKNNNLTLILVSNKCSIHRNIFGKYLVSSNINSKTIDSFIIDGYRYVLDIDGLWIDNNYREVHNDTKITCAKWINHNINISKNAVPIKSTFDYELTDDTFNFNLNDNTNKQTTSFMLSLF